MLFVADSGAFLKRIDNMVLMPDGNVFCKFTEKTWGYSIYNPLTNLRGADFANHEYATNSPSYGKGVLCADKKTIVFPPRNWKQPLIYNSQANTFNITSAWEEEIITVTTNRYLGGTLLPDGRVFFPPYHAEYAAIYNPLDDSVQKITTVFSGGSTPAYNGAYLLPNGKIFLIAGTKAFALLDLGNLVLTEISELTNYKRYIHAVMTVDELLILFPEPGYNNKCLVYDYASNSLVNSNSIDPSDAACKGVSLLGNGSILALYPTGLWSIKIKNNGSLFEKTKLHLNTELDINSKMIGLLNGNSLIVPEGTGISNIPYIFKPGIDLVPFHPSVYLSPFYNRS